jgi:hypothetical protein
MSHFVEPLAELCENYIVEHLEEFPVSHLFLLPLSKRRDLLWRLPIADVCLRLENTDFVKGLDMAAYWKLPCENPASDVNFQEDSDIKQYVAERWPNEIEYAKAWLYGRVAACEIGCLGDSHEFVLPENESASCDALSLLYCVRLLHWDGWNRLSTFPPRYQQVKKLLEPPSWLLTKQQEQDIIDAIVSVFNGERPKMLPEAQVLTEPHHWCGLRNADLALLSEVEYVGVQCQPFDDSSVEWLVKLVNNASNLQVIVLQGYNVTSQYFCLDLDTFCERLATCRPFWSKFRILKVVPGIYDELEKDYGVDTPEKYTVLLASLNQLITAYLSAPTNHSQLVEFSYTDIIKITESQDTQDSYTIIVSRDTNSDYSVDQTCVPFKNIRLSDCNFDSNKATPDLISKWLGHQIKILEEEEETSSVLFQIDHKDRHSVLGHKRKHC